MATTTDYRGVDPALIVELQEGLDPDTGRFRTADVIRRILKDEHDIDMTVAAVRQKAYRYRQAHGLGPPPIVAKTDLPWVLSEEAHHDSNGYAVHRIARREKAREAGEEATFHESELRALAAFEKYLARTGPDTVIAFDAEANQGKGGWVVRQRVEGEVVRYGVMAARPYPEMG